ncbi:MAG: hypothetical protein KIT73_10660 [Burkholderiales bacterium]|jgi:hypothetical protein|nr:hypothetical protein [Burkholderiales bacterium]
MSKTGVRSLLCAAALAAIVGQVGCATAQTPSPTEKALASAKTKADHEAIAADYEKAAGTAKAEAQKHRNLAKFYHSSPTGRGDGSHGMASHCENLAKLSDQAAAEYLDLAKAHKETAADMK